MFAKSLTILCVVAAAAAAATSKRGDSEVFKPFEGVDPNSLSCDPSGQEFLLLPDWEDCNKFYVCDHGKEVPFTCSTPSLIFDFELQGCNWPDLGTCTLRTREEEEEGSGFDDGQDIITNFNIRSAQPEVHFDNVLQCSNPAEASRQVPYKGDCQRFWRCESGVPQTAYCTDGLFFNAATQQCDFEANAKCFVEVSDDLQGEFMLFE